MVVGATNNHNGSRSFGNEEVACEPDSGMDTISKLVDHPVPLKIDVSDMHRVIPSRYISIRSLRTRGIGVKAGSRGGLYLDLEGILGFWGSIGTLGWPG